MRGKALEGWCARGALRWETPSLLLAVDQPMDVFGGAWSGYVEKLREGLSLLTGRDTLVLCGDISWGDESGAGEKRDLPFWKPARAASSSSRETRRYWWNTT